jgi:hypothetical protein
MFFFVRGGRIQGSPPRARRKSAQSGPKTGQNRLKVRRIEGKTTIPIEISHKK